MTALTTTTRVARPVPSVLERLLLQSAHGLESVASARMERRARRTAPGLESARDAADEKRRDAQALGNLGVLPR